MDQLTSQKRKPTASLPSSISIPSPSSASFSSSPPSSSSSTTTSHLPHPLLSALLPVRHCFHCFLSPLEVFRLLLVSRSISSSLLFGLTFHHHVFRPPTTDHLNQLLALCNNYHLRITRLCLPRKFSSPLINPSTGRCILPSSLVALAMGEVPATADDPSTCDGLPSVFLRASLMESASSAECIKVTKNAFRGWSFPPCREAWGEWNLTLPPSAIPPSVKYLQLPSGFNQPLEVGSIPSSVLFLQLSYAFCHPLEVGMLPPSLSHLVFGWSFTSPLLAGVLPASLQYLYMDNYGQAAVALPPQIKGIDCGWSASDGLSIAGRLPSSLTHLTVGEEQRAPLHEGSLPEGLTHLNLGGHYNSPLKRSVLPSTLLELTLSYRFNQSLHWGDLPSSLLFLDINPRYKQRIERGAIPSSVRLLVLPLRYRGKRGREGKEIIPNGAEVLWWKERVTSYGLTYSKRTEAEVAAEELEKERHEDEEEEAEEE